MIGLCYGAVFFSFGIKPTKEKEYHQGVMTTMVDDCQFVCIAQENYYEILSAVSACNSLSGYGQHRSCLLLC